MSQCVRKMREGAAVCPGWPGQTVTPEIYPYQLSYVPDCCVGGAVCLPAILRARVGSQTQEHAGGAQPYCRYSCTRARRPEHAESRRGDFEMGAIGAACASWQSVFVRNGRMGVAGSRLSVSVRAVPRCRQV